MVRVPPFFALSGGAVACWYWDGTRLWALVPPPPPPPHDARVMLTPASASTGTSSLSHLNRIFVPFRWGGLRIGFSIYSIKSSSPWD
jgi:hypothetical protein